MGKKVVIMSFSSRNNGNCAAIAEHIDQLHKRTNVLSFQIDNDSFPPCGGCDYECLKKNLVCPNLTDKQKEVMNAICDSELVYFIIPNYCGYPCANYFAFNERSVGYFNLNRSLMEKYMTVQKRFIIVSNSEEHFVQAMQQQTNDIPDILYLQSSKYGKQSIAGDILDSDEAKADLEAFLFHDRFLQSYYSTNPL